MLEQIRRRLLAKNFIPFVIRTTDGEQFPVPTRDHAWAPPHGARVYVLHDDGTTDCFPGPHIASISDQGQTADAVTD